MDWTSESEEDEFHEPFTDMANTSQQTDDSSTQNDGESKYDHFTYSVNGLLRRSAGCLRGQSTYLSWRCRGHLLWSIQSDGRRVLHTSSSPSRRSVHLFVSYQVQNQSGVVVFPGMIFPLLFGGNGITQRSVENALSANAPLHGLIAVFNDRALNFDDTDTFVTGCLAEIKQIGQSEDHIISAIALGKQRIRINVKSLLDDHPFGNRILKTKCVLLSEATAPMIPSEFTKGFANWPQWIARSSDPFYLANIAFEKAQGVLENVPDLRNDPRQFSYSLASSLPLDSSTRQQLLEQDNVSYRLQQEIKIMSYMTGIFCDECKHRLADLDDLMTSEDQSISSQIFVNPNGFVHDMMMLREVSGIRITGRETTEHSWFPGYAWVLAHCSHCLTHIGWMFKATRKNLEPSVFWGFSRSQITHERPFNENPNTIDDGN